MTDRLIYPTTRMDPVVENYHGTPIADPYRWLEDDRSPETAAWVEAQNRVTHAHLDRIPFRQALRDRLMTLVNYPRQSAPEVKGRWRLFARNEGLQNQPVYYLQEGDDGEAQLLIDPNALSPDGTTRVAGLTFDQQGHHLAYMVSHAGSDWQQIRVIHLATGETLPDVVDWV